MNSRNDNRLPGGERLQSITAGFVPSVTTLVSNLALHRTPSSPYVRTIRVAKGFDGADHRIGQEVRPGDLVITADLPLAAADQRIRFYAEDDPYVRDGRIKPEWDRALDRLESGRREIDDARAAIDLALEEGRRAGAEPGWLLEGLELEPAPAPTACPSGPGEPRSGAEPREPNVVVEPPR